MMQKNILLFDHIKNIFSGQITWRYRREARVYVFWRSNCQITGQFTEESKIQGSIDHIDITILEIQFGLQKAYVPLEGRDRIARVNFKADGHAVFTLLQVILDDHKQIIRTIFMQFQIRVAGDATAEAICDGEAFE